MKNRITCDPKVMGGDPCIRGMSITVHHLLEQLAAGSTEAEVLEDLPVLEQADIRAALFYAAQVVANDAAMRRGIAPTTTWLADLTELAMNEETVTLRCTRQGWWKCWHGGNGPSKGWTVGEAVADALDWQRGDRRRRP